MGRRHDDELQRLSRNIVPHSNFLGACLPCYHVGWIFGDTRMSTTANSNSSNGTSKNHPPTCRFVDIFSVNLPAHGLNFSDGQKIVLCYVICEIKQKKSGDRSGGSDPEPCILMGSSVVAIKPARVRHIMHVMEME